MRKALDTHADLAIRLLSDGGICECVAKNELRDSLCENVYLLTSGVVIARRIVHGKRVDRLYMAGDIIGLYNIASLRPVLTPQEKLVALTDVSALKWTTGEVLDSGGQSSEQAFLLANLMADAIADEKAWGSFRTGRVAQRAAALFLYLNMRYGLDGLMPPLSHAEWSHILGGTREGVTVLFSKLRNLRLIEFEQTNSHLRSRVRISRVPALEQFASAVRVRKKK